VGVSQKTKPKKKGNSEEYVNQRNREGMGQDVQTEEGIGMSSEKEWASKGRNTRLKKERGP